MINIGFTLQEAEELKLYYATEINKVTNRLTELQNIYNKLGNHTEEVITQKETVIKSEPVVKIEIPKTEKRTRKSRTKKEVVQKPVAKIIEVKEIERTKTWRNLILDLLASKAKPITRQDLIIELAKQFNTDIKKVDGNVTMALQKLKKDNLVISQKKGKKSLLSLNTTEQKTPIEKTKKSRAPRKTKEADVIQKIKKENHNSVWPDFVVTTLIKENRFMQAAELVEIAMKQFNVPIQKKGQLRAQLASGLSRMERINKKLKSTKVKGAKSSVYGLIEWYNEDGTIKQEFRTVTIK